MLMYAGVSIDIDINISIGVGINYTDNVYYIDNIYYTLQAFRHEINSYIIYLYYYIRDYIVCFELSIDLLNRLDFVVF